MTSKRSLSTADADLDKFLNNPNQNLNIFYQGTILNHKEKIIQNKNFCVPFSVSGEVFYCDRKGNIAILGFDNKKNKNLPIFLHPFSNSDLKKLINPAADNTELVKRACFKDNKGNYKIDVKWLMELILDVKFIVNYSDESNDKYSLVRCDFLKVVISYCEVLNCNAKSPIVDTALLFYVFFKFGNIFNKIN